SPFQSRQKSPASHAAAPFTLQLLHNPQSIMPANNFPKLHNAMWPGFVGKGSPGGEPIIALDTLLDLTAKADVGGVKFDGVDLFLYQPHTDIDISDDGLKALAAKIKAKKLVVGSVVAPVWFDASAMGNETQRAAWVTH